VREIEASDVVALIEGAGLTWGESNMLLIFATCVDDTSGGSPLPALLQHPHACLPAGNSAPQWPELQEPHQGAADG
jgi:hypothetical protein